MGGSLSIPNTFGASSGNVPASQLDTDFTTIRDYINNREITLGLLSARPAASVSGRLYYATDSQQLFEDNGASWTAIAISSGGGWGFRNLTGANDGSTPNTKFNLSADLVVLRNPSSGGLSVQTSTGTLTCNLGTTGANALDTGTQQASTWYYFYFIWNGATLATLASATAPMTGPALPSGYTHWAYACAVYSDAATHLVPTRVRGMWMTYEVLQVALNAGTATTETNVSLTTLIPPAAMEVRIEAEAKYQNGAANQLNTLFVRTTTTNTQVTLAVNTQVLNIDVYNSTLAALPNINQNLIYLWNVNAGTRAGTIWVAGYSVENGAI